MGWWIALIVVVALVIWARKGVVLFLRSFGPVFLKKLPTAILTLVMVSALVFFGAQAIGGQEDMLIKEGRMDARTIEALRERYGFNDPIMVQYWNHLKLLIQFDSLPSPHQNNRTFRDILNNHLMVTVSLGWRALALAVIFGVPLGILTALWHNRWPDQAGMVLALIGVSVPNFIIATVLLYFLSRKWQIFPATEWADPVRMWIPAVALGAFPFAAVLRLTRASMLEALREDYVRTARAKGLSETKVVAKHALRNSLSAVVTYLGPVAAGLMVGSLVVETIFNIPGIGDMFVVSVQNRDVPLIMSISVLYCILLVSANLLVDSLYPVLNPRLRD